LLILTVTAREAAPANHARHRCQPRSELAGTHLAVKSGTCALAATSGHI